MNRQQPPDWWTDALAKVVYGIRRNTHTTTDDAQRWDYPGIKAAIQRVNQTVGPADTAIVMSRGADNPKIQTPGGIAEPGPQWADTAVADRPQPKRCSVHHLLLQAGDCPECSKRASSNRPANFHELFERARAEENTKREQQRQEAIQP